MRRISKYTIIAALVLMTVVISADAVKEEKKCLIRSRRW